jgi:hypothetical protein
MKGAHRLKLPLARNLCRKDERVFFKAAQNNLRCGGQNRLLQLGHAIV